MCSVDVSYFRLRLWKDSLTDVPASVFVGWIWRGPALLASYKPTAHRGGPCEISDEEMGYLDDAQSVDCDCGEQHTMGHLLSCRLLDEACTADDLATVTERAMACAWQVGETCVKDMKGEELFQHFHQSTDFPIASQRALPVTRVDCNGSPTILSCSLALDNSHSCPFLDVISPCRTWTATHLLSTSYTSRYRAYVNILS